MYLQIQYLYCGGDYEAPVSPANPAGAVRVDYDGCMVCSLDLFSSNLRAIER